MNRGGVDLNEMRCAVLLFRGHVPGEANVYGQDCRLLLKEERGGGKKSEASSASASPIARPKAPRANASKRNAGLATARNGAPDARDASASSNAGTASTAVDTKAMTG